MASCKTVMLNSFFCFCISYLTLTYFSTAHPVKCSNMDAQCAVMPNALHSQHFWIKFIYVLSKILWRKYINAPERTWGDIQAVERLYRKAHNMNPVIIVIFLLFLLFLWWIFFFRPLSLPPWWYVQAQHLLEMDNIQLSKHFVTYKHICSSLR